MTTAVRTAVWGAFLFILLLAARQEMKTRNTDSNAWDQGAVLALSDSIRASGSLFRTDANRHPLFPLLLVPLRSPGTSGFHRAQIAAMAVGALFFAVLFFLFGRKGPLTLSVFLAAALALPPGLPLLLTQVIPDLLFTLLNLLAWYFLAKSFTRWKHALWGGVFAGLAFLAKFSGFMTLEIFLACMTVWGCVTLVRRQFRPAGDALKALLGATMLFAVVASPLLVYNQRTHGRMFYNVNSDYYLWAESWKACKDFSVLSHDRSDAEIHQAALLAMDPAEILSARNFFRQHSIGFIVMRIKAGLHLNGLAWWQGRGYFFLLLGAFVLLALYRLGFSTALMRLRSPATLFSLAYVAVYFTSLCWYAAIAFSLRFLYPLHALLAVGFFLWLKKGPEADQPPVK